MEDTKQRERPSHCTCGTRLVKDALFCHRCGRPVFQSPVGGDDDSGDISSDSATVDTTAVAPPPSVSGSTSTRSGTALRRGYEGPPEPIDLRNKLAVQIAFFVAVLEFPLVSLSQIFPLNPMVVSALLVCLGGFCCAFLYQHRTNSRLGALNGFRLGWISGLLLFLLILVFGALQFAFFSFSGGSLMGQIEEVLQASGSASLPPEQQQILREIFTDWTKLFILMLVALFVLFLFFTACAGLGGVLGARSKSSQSRT